MRRTQLMSDFLLLRRIVTTEGIRLNIEEMHEVLASFACFTLESYYIALVDIRNKLKNDYNIIDTEIDHAIAAYIDYYSVKNNTPRITVIKLNMKV